MDKHQIWGINWGTNRGTNRGTNWSRIAAVSLALAFAFLAPLALLPAGAAQAESAAAEPGAALFETLWPRIDGSTATQPLTNAIYAHFTGIEPSEGEPAIRHSKTYNAYERLFVGEDWVTKDPADLIFVTAPYDEELAKIGEEFELIPVVKDALVFLNNQQNPITGLTSEQLRAIYTGGTTDWAELGGQPGQIKAYQRPEESGSQTLFQNLLMRELEPVKAPPEWYISEMGFLVNAVAAYDNANFALGYNMYYFVANMQYDWRVRMLAVDGVEPTFASIAADEYPLNTAYYAIYRKDLPADHPARALVAWLLTDEGQRVAQSAGYVPLRPLPEAPLPACVTKRPDTDEGTAPAGNRWAEPPRYTEAVFARVLDQDALQREQDESWYDPQEDENLPLVVTLPDQPELSAEINAWLAQAGEELTRWLAMNEAEDLVPSTRWQLNDNLLSLSLRVYIWEPEEKLACRRAVFDLKAGKRLRLADLFYQGFDYLRYIDDALLSIRSDLLAGEDKRIAAFDGISPDLDFSLDYKGQLRLALEDHPVFYDLYDDIDYITPVNQAMRIWHGISPFGACKVELEYVGVMPPESERQVYVPRVRIDDGAHPEAQAAIQAELDSAAQRFRAHKPYQVLPGDGLNIQPYVDQCGRFWSIRYPEDYGWEGSTGVLWAQAFDLHTGKALIQPEQMRELLERPDTTYNFISENYQSDWRPIDLAMFPEGSTLTGVELGESEAGVLLSLDLRVQPPEGEASWVRVSAAGLDLPGAADFD